MKIHVQTIPENLAFFFKSRLRSRPWVKGENLVLKKKSKIPIFTVEIFVFMTHGKFPPRNIGPNESMLHGFEAFGRQGQGSRTLEFWMTNLKFELFLGGI